MIKRSVHAILFLQTIIFLLTLTSCNGNDHFDPRGRHWPMSPPDIVKVASGEQVALALDNHGRVWTWGLSSFNSWQGQEAPGLVPVWTSEGKQFGNIKSIAVGENQDCYAIDNKGQLWAWNGDHFGSEGTAPPRTTIYPAPVIFQDGKLFDKVISVSGAGSTTLAVRSDGTVWGCGQNWGGILTRNPKSWVAPKGLFKGLEEAIQDYFNPNYGSKRLDGVPYPILILTDDGSPMRDAVAVNGSFEHALVLKRDGTIWGFGDRPETIWPSGYGMFFDVEHPEFRDWVPTQSMAGRNLGSTKVKSIITTQTFSVALLSDGTVLTWGDSSYGALGHGAIFSYVSPGRMRDTRNLRFRPKSDHDLIPNGPIIQNIKQVATVNEAIILLTKNGKVLYQGFGFDGAGGNVLPLNDFSQVNSSNVPVLTEVSHTDGTIFQLVRSIAGNNIDTGILVDNHGQVWAWGDNYFHLCGNSGGPALFPVRLLSYHFDDSLNNWVPNE